MADLTRTDQGSELILLTAIRDRLVNRVDGLTAANCVLSDDAVPLVWPADPCCTVSIGDSQFNPELWEGGGSNQLTIRTTVLVTMFCRCVLDRPPAAESVLLNRDRGLLLKWKPAILKALLVNDATWATSCCRVCWEPLTEDGYPILRQAMRPISCTSPRYVPPDREGAIPFMAWTLTLEAEYDWKL